MTWVRTAFLVSILGAALLFGSLQGRRQFGHFGAVGTGGAPIVLRNVETVRVDSRDLQVDFTNDTSRASLVLPREAGVGGVVAARVALQRNGESIVGGLDVEIVEIGTFETARFAGVIGGMKVEGGFRVKLPETATVLAAVQ